MSKVAEVFCRPSVLIETPEPPKLLFTLKIILV